MEIAFTDLDFLLRSPQNCMKCTFLNSLRTITQEGNMETRQITPFFSSTFSTMFVTFIFVFENSQNSFSFGPALGPFWSVKYLNFGQKLLFRTAHDTFLASRHPLLSRHPLFYLIFRYGACFEQGVP